MANIKIESSQVITIVRVLVSEGTMPDDAVRLRKQLEAAYAKEYDEDDDNVYTALNGLLGASGVSGDYNIDRPTFEVWGSNGKDKPWRLA